MNNPALSVCDQCGSGKEIKDSGNHTRLQTAPCWTLPSLQEKRLSLCLWALGRPTKST